MQRRIFIICFRPVAIISECKLLSDLRDVLQTYSVAESITEDQPDKLIRTTLFQAAKLVLIPPNTSAPVSVKTRSKGPTQEDSHLNSVPNTTVLPVPCIADALLHVLANLNISIFARNRPYCSAVC